jgi:hypothetical protein
MQVLCGAAHSTLLSLNLGPRFNLSGLDLLYFTSPFVVLFIFPAFFLASEHEVLGEFVSSEGFGQTLLLLLVGCAIAVVFSEF